MLPFMAAALQQPSTAWLVTGFLPGGTLHTWLYGASTGDVKSQQPLLKRLHMALDVSSTSSPSSLGHVMRARLGQARLHSDLLHACPRTNKILFAVSSPFTS